METKKRIQGNKLISIIGDQDTVTGFLLTGIGERNVKGQTNYFIVDDSYSFLLETSAKAVEQNFNRFLKEPNISVILITQEVSEKFLKVAITQYEGISPVILEIPSKQSSYDPKKDIIMQRAHRTLFGTEIQ